MTRRRGFNEIQPGQTEAGGLADTCRVKGRRDHVVVGPRHFTIIIFIIIMFIFHFSFGRFCSLVHATVVMGRFFWGLFSPGILDIPKTMDGRSAI